jgi:putative SOS response-associated peptidase YedK
MIIVLYMCGKYVIVNGKPVLQSFGKLYLERIQDTFSDLPRFNASPNQRLPVVAAKNNKLITEKMHWRLISHWSKDGKTKATTLNAKSETLGESKLFAPYFKSSRCLIPVDTFYERKNGSPKEKRPMSIRMKVEQTFYFAGLFSISKDEKREEFPSFTIITTEPNKLMAEIHTRMLIIVPKKHYGHWLDMNIKILTT